MARMWRVGTLAEAFARQRMAHEMAHGPVTRMSGPEQTEKEIRAFRHFVAQAGLPVVPESVEKRNPPEPDMLCLFTDGGRVAFELVEVCHPENAKFFGRAPALADLIERAYRTFRPS